MAEITGATITYTDYSAPGTPRLLNIPDAWGDASVQDLWDTLSFHAAKVENLVYKNLIDRPKGGGKGVLSATKSVGISLVGNNVQAKFFDQPGPAYVIKRVIDGNFTAIDHNGAALEAIASSDFTNWKNEADTSAAIITTGGSALTAGEKIQLANASDAATYQNKIINNVKELLKISGSWYLIIYDTGEISGGIEILRKQLTDSLGNDISDLTAGVLAAELESTA